MKEKCPKCGSKESQHRGTRDEGKTVVIYYKCHKCWTFYRCTYEKVLKKVELL